MAKLKKCKHCGAEIAKSAKICPHCGGKNKGGLGKLILIVVVVILLLAVIASVGNSGKSADTGSAAPAETEASTETAAEAEAPAEEEAAPAVATASDPENMVVGDIAECGDFYAGLSCVRTLDYLQTAIEDYTEDVASGDEVVYVILDVYNASDDTESFGQDISVYADGVQIGDVPDSYFLAAIDGVEEYNSYEMDPGTRCLILDTFEVTKGWQELTVYAGSDCCWTVTPEDVSDGFDGTSLYDAYVTAEPTAEGTVLYDEDYQLTYDGFEVSSDCAVFKFTVNNTSDEALDYSMVGYEMRGYLDGYLLDDADYILDDVIDGHNNVFTVDEIQSGMSAQVYVAFDLSGAATGGFTCVYDAGYLFNDILGTVTAAN